MGLPVPDPVIFPGELVTVNPVIADPPVPLAVNVTDAKVFPAVAVPIVGGAGAFVVDGVTALLAADGALVPIALAAVTVNVYVTEFVSPKTVIGLDVLTPVNPPGFDVAVNPVIGEPPVLLAVNVTDADVLTADATPMVGATGTVAMNGVTLLLNADGALVPSEFVAVTENVYAVPFVRPLTVIGLLSPVAEMAPGFEVMV